MRFDCCLQIRILQKGGKPNCLIGNFGEVEQWNFDDKENYQQWQWQQQKKLTCQWGNVKLQQAPYAQTNNNGQLEGDKFASEYEVIQCCKLTIN